ncbi:cytochrome c biogenesis protein ResB [Nocardioides sp.]|uniref:cytochrome c biogenesis protein ResB n=1 Tax=Nocardioides sp. TaxID=35761 RepID=UPI00262477CC|nr:cytochrome c biogenesis protein ResB [Nocardioides sp.]
MRTAVVLLILLAVAAVPGSLLPQRGVASDPAAVPLFYRANPDLAPWLDRLYLFDVYSAPWFAAIYLLLLVSMTGCVLPRCARLWREVTAPPPAAPRRLERETGHTSLTVPDAPAALAAAAEHLRSRRFRVVRTDGEVRAEKGHVRELGNLAFHLSLLVLLVGVAGGRLFGYEGRVAVVEGSTFTNIASAYDALTPAPLADRDGLEPLEFTLRSFDAQFETSGPRLGEPRAFTAALDWVTPDDSGTAEVRPNQPFDVDGTKFFLTGHGYAPQVTVRDGRGDVAASGPVIFLPQDQAFTSDGVVKVPDARPTPLALQGLFLPTAARGADGVDVSAYPGLVNPALLLTAYSGDLGLDDGGAQSVYTLDLDGLVEVEGDDGERWRVTLAPGETVRLPDGLGTVTFDGVARFANFQVARDPGKEISLVAALLLLAGLTVSLGVPRRRAWVRLLDDSTVEVGWRHLGRRRSADTDAAALSAAIQPVHHTHPESTT